MGIAEDILGPDGWHAAMAALVWQMELGATELIGDDPVNNYDLTVEAPWQARSATRGATPAVAIASPAEVAARSAETALADARSLAAQAASLEDLRVAMHRYDHCELKRGAKNLVFADGLPGARVMLVGEAPGRDEDIEGRPFVGRAGKLLDAMFAAIGLQRTSSDTQHAIYITNVVPWRPAMNRDPTPDEVAMMRPFLQRHIELADPDVIVALGNTPCAALLGKTGILRMRGTWDSVFGKPVLPMVHPAYLLRNPAAKREAWADLLTLKARLKT